MDWFITLQLFFCRRVWFCASLSAEEAKRNQKGEALEKLVAEQLSFT